MNINCHLFLLEDVPLLQGSEINLEEMFLQHDRARPRTENKFLCLLREYFMTMSTLFKVMVFGDVTLCSVVTDISVLEKHVVEVTLKMEASHSLETVLSALLHDVDPEDQIFGMFRH